MTTLSNAEGRALLAGKGTKTKPPAKAKASESQQQAACVRWFRLQYPEYRKLLWAVPNGGKRNKITAAILKKEGVLPGIPDLVLCLAKNGFHGLFIEQKIRGNTTSDYQKEMIKLLTEQGYQVRVVYSFDEFKQVINDYLN